MIPVSVLMSGSWNIKFKAKFSKKQWNDTPNEVQVTATKVLAEYLFCMLKLKPKYEYLHEY